jgi:hypothetical protein
VLHARRLGFAQALQQRLRLPAHEPPHDPPAPRHQHVPVLGRAVREVRRATDPEHDVRAPERAALTHPPHPGLLQDPQGCPVGRLRQRDDLVELQLSGHPRAASVAYPRPHHAYPSV